MSELINTPAARADFRSRLLATACAFALPALACSTADAADSDADHPQVWIELGGQLEAVAGRGQPFTAPFMSTYADSPAFKPSSPVEAQNTSKYSFGGEGRISFEPEDTKWVFTAAVRYGRSGGNKQIHQQTPGIKLPASGTLYNCAQCVHTYDFQKFSETSAVTHESHAILDFQVGKDVGLGLFGKGGTSVASLGVRFAQFTSEADFTLHARPDLTFPGKYQKYFHTFSVAAQSARSFHGMGPSLAWNGSAELFGNREDGGLTIDWGANAALLFGRQKASVQHQTIARTYKMKYGYRPLYQHTGGHNQARSVIVPNIGGSAGISYRFEAAALSLGYRADLFLGAVDAGIDARQSKLLGFYGPFATISIGLGG